MKLHFLSIALLLSGTIVVADNGESQRQTRYPSQRPSNRDKDGLFYLHGSMPLRPDSEKDIHLNFLLPFIESVEDFEKKELSDGMEYDLGIPTDLIAFAALDPKVAPFLPFVKIACILRVDETQSKDRLIRGTEDCSINIKTVDLAAVIEAETFKQRRTQK